MNNGVDHVSQDVLDLVLLEEEFCLIDSLRTLFAHNYIIVKSNSLADDLEGILYSLNDVGEVVHDLILLIEALIHLLL